MSETPSPQQRADQGWKLLKEAVLGLLRQDPAGKTCSEMGHALGLQDSRRKKYHGYVVWTVLGHLLSEGLVVYDEETKLYRLSEGQP
ncbi:MAG: hypothetical protein HND43_01185 [Armatimonadetes bacterium]|nr:hypothetical protein [Armatimonadota bacterium]NOG37998.1 hypothetical protein [Armatimonadota bacterium]GIK31887.1 MAG: hypothetical protein BroJett009_08790 [Armatimonadota bacterium]HQU18516.1 hypothetical protein [Fimbriimonadaceae bacterium]